MGEIEEPELTAAEFLKGEETGVRPDSFLPSRQSKESGKMVRVRCWVALLRTGHCWASTPPPISLAENRGLVLQASSLDQNGNTTLAMQGHVFKRTYVIYEPKCINHFSNWDQGS